MKNSRLTTAIHILVSTDVFYRHNKGKTITSEELAFSVNTNPALIRKLLGMLGKAGLVESQPGVGGGTRLARAPDKITLLDVYRAVDNKIAFSLHANQPSRICPVGCNIQPVLQNVFDQAECAMEFVLKKTNIAEIANQTMARYTNQM